MNNSLDYYNRHAEKYYMNTAKVDMSKVYKTFLQFLSPGALILDAGCGSGLDRLYFLTKMN